MRLFVALRPPLAALRELDEALIPARVANLHVRWSDPRDWHVTLAFLGEVPDERHEALVRSLARAARRNTSFPLGLAIGGQFSSRVLWIGLRGDVTALHSLAGQSRAAADEIGLTLDQRPLQAHLTIGHGGHSQRDNAGGPGSTAEINALSENLAAFNGITWNVDRLWLMSVRPHQSPRYDVDASWELQEGGAPLAGGDLCGWNPCEAPEMAAVPHAHGDRKPPAGIPMTLPMDAKIFTIFEGTSEIQRMLIGRTITGLDVR